MFKILSVIILRLRIVLKIRQQLVDIPALPSARLVPAADGSGDRPRRPCKHNRLISARTIQILAILSRRAGRVFRCKGVGLSASTC